jgi:hypothetical protein
MRSPRCCASETWTASTSAAASSGTQASACKATSMQAAIVPLGMPALLAHQQAHRACGPKRLYQPKRCVEHGASLGTGTLCIHSMWDSFRCCCHAMHFFGRRGMPGSMCTSGENCVWLGRTAGLAHHRLHMPMWPIRHNCRLWYSMCTAEGKHEKGPACTEHYGAGSLLAGLPLLQPELRQHVKRTFASAAKALDVIASPLHQLRAQLHLEIAKCELADESQLKVRCQGRHPPCTASGRWCPQGQTQHEATTLPYWVRDVLHADPQDLKQLRCLGCWPGLLLH